MSIFVFHVLGGRSHCLDYSDYNGACVPVYTTEDAPINISLRGGAAGINRTLGRPVRQA